MADGFFDALSRAAKNDLLKGIVAQTEKQTVFKSLMQGVTVKSSHSFYDSIFKVGGKAQPRHPRGSSKGGQFASKGGAGGGGLSVPKGGKVGKETVLNASIKLLASSQGTATVEAVAGAVYSAKAKIGGNETNKAYWGKKLDAMNDAATAVAAGKVHPDTLALHQPTKSAPPVMHAAYASVKAAVGKAQEGEEAAQGKPAGAALKVMTSAAPKQMDKDQILNIQEAAATGDTTSLATPVEPVPYGDAAKQKWIANKTAKIKQAAATGDISVLEGQKPVKGYPPAMHKFYADTLALAKAAKGEQPLKPAEITAKTATSGKKATFETIAGKPTPNAAGGGKSVVSFGPGHETALTKLSGNKGSNPGGVYQDAVGQKFYLKEQKTAAHAKNEELSSALYALAGTRAPAVSGGKMDGKDVTLTKWDDSLKKFDENDPVHRAEAIKHFGTHAWLANWDAAGASFDNQMMTPTGRAMTIDVGGAMFFRAKGGTKTFDANVDELQTLMNPQKNAQAAKVFGTTLTSDHLASIKRITDLSDKDIDDVVSKIAPTGVAGNSSKSVAATLKARRDTMKKFYQEETAPPSDLGDLPKPSKALSAMEDAGSVKTLQKLAAKGDIDAIAGLHSKAGAYSQSAQELAAYKSELIKHVAGKKGAATDLPLKLPGELATQLAKAAPAVPPHKVAGHANKTFGYLNLGTGPAAPTSLDSKAGFRNLYLGNEHSITNNADPADQKIAKKLQSMLRTAHKSTSDEYKSSMGFYKGSGYVPMNNALRTGEWSGAMGQRAKTIYQGFREHAVDLPEGMILHRGVDLDDGGTKRFSKMAAATGQIIQEPTFVSTSYGGKAAFDQKNTQFRIHLSKGVRGMFPTSNTESDGENEIVLPPGTRYQVVSVYTRPDGKMGVDVLALPTEMPDV